MVYDFNNIRIETSFKSFSQLRLLLEFLQKNNLYKINIPCKNSLKKYFLIDSIKITREEFPNIDIIPHFSILHEFRRNRNNTQKAFIEFLHLVKNHGISNVLLVSGSRKRATLDSVSSLNLMKENPLFLNSNFSLGVAFNPYLPSDEFDDEIIRLKEKIQSGIVSSIWIQFGTNSTVLKRRIEVLKNIISLTIKNNSKISNISLFGSILIPSKQFLARFKYRPWKGVYCSNEFLESVDLANKLVKELLKTYMKYNICPIIETSVSNDDQLESLKMLLEI